MGYSKTHVHNISIYLPKYTSPLSLSLRRLPYTPPPLSLSEPVFSLPHRHAIELDCVYSVTSFHAVYVTFQLAYPVNMISVVWELNIHHRDRD